MRTFSAALLAAALAGCPAPAPSSPGQTDGDELAVRRLDGGPNLVVIAREGDPRPAASVALHAPGDPAARLALAQVLAGRLSQYEVVARASAEAIRVTAVPADEPWAGRLATALQAPVTAEELAAAPVQAALRAAARRPRPPEALAPIARCTGEIVVDDPEVEAPAVEALRSRLSGAHMAVAVVAPPELAETLADALARPRWPRGTPAPSAPWAPSHRAYATGDVELRVDVALRVGAAPSAVGAARRLEEPSPLSHQLALLDPPWDVVAVSGHAAPRGGCLRVTIEPHEPPRSWSKPAGVAAQVAVEELGRELAPPGGDASMRAVHTAGDAQTTAELAAWWALHEASTEATVALSAAAVPGRLPAAPDHGGLPDTEIDAYRSTVESPSPAPAFPSPRVTVERGQGELWMLAAQPCALRAEGRWDWGRAALAATAVAAEQTRPETIEAWVSPHGVGLLAHDAPRDGESPDALARRVGDALGAALTSLPRDARRFERAKRRVLQHTSSEPMRALALLAEQRSSDHPSELSPWGRPPIEVTALDVQQRWRALLGGPWRFAIHARHSKGEATTAMAALHRWYRGPTVEVTCPVGPPPPFDAQRATVADVEPEAQIVVAARGAGAAAEVVTQALEGAGGLLAGSLDAIGWHGSARVVGVGPRRTLVVLAHGAPPEAAEAQRRLEGLLRTLAESGLTDATLARAQDRRAARSLEELATPAGRIEMTWRGTSETAPVDGDAVATYCASALTAPQLSWVTDQSAESE